MKNYTVNININMYYILECRYFKVLNNPNILNVFQEECVVDLMLGGDGITIYYNPFTYIDGLNG